MYWNEFSRNPQGGLGDRAQKVTGEVERSELVDLFSLMNQKGIILLSSAT